jgi:hypothetical protein
VNVTFHDDAVAEYIAAVVWYERDYPGRGERFSAAVERALANLVRAPHAFAKRLGYVAVPVHRFPYVLFVEQTSDGETLRVPLHMQSDAPDTGSGADIGGAAPFDQDPSANLRNSARRSASDIASEVAYAPGRSAGSTSSGTGFVRPLILSSST